MELKEVTGKTFGNRLRLRVCGLCIKDDALLLVRHEGLGPKGILWAPPGGGVELYEPAEEALGREFREETGLNVNVQNFLFANEFIEEPLHAVELFFKVTAVSGEIHLGNDPEISKENQLLKEIKFVSFEELQLISTDELHGALQNITGFDALFNMRGYFKF